ncbi:MAG: GDP-L-fucose synthase [Patescibacteria group bacterium]
MNKPNSKTSSMVKFPKLLITGGNGLVGTAIKKLGIPDAVFVARADADLRDFKLTKALFEKIKPTHVIHLAAHVGGVGGNSLHPGEYFRDNILINTNVLEAARLTGVKKLVSMLSTCIFPDPAIFPLKAEDLHKGQPHPSNFGYAYAKRMLEVQTNAYRKEWGCDYITLVGTNIYGPNDNFSLENGHVVSSLVHKCFLAKKNKTDLEVWGSGKPLREFVLSDDIAKLTVWAIESYDEAEPLMLSSGIETSIKELVLLVAEKMKFTGRVIFDTKKTDGQLRKPSDTTKFLKYLPEFKFTPVEDGVEKTVNWFVENYPNVRK